MKFTYRYRSSDNARHEGVVNAATKAAAYEFLRSQGIRPERVDEAPGFFNKLFGRGKRWIAIVALSIAVLTMTITMRQADSRSQLGLDDDAITSFVRRQPIGDSATIDLGVKTGWAEVFEKQGDRFLASFAIPGVSAAVRSATESDVMACLEDEAVPTSEDGLEARQIKSMVLGLKKEIRGLLKEGWTLREVGDALARRQDRELQIYNRAKQEIETAEKSLGERELIELWKQRNEALRRLGIRTVPLKDS